MVWLKEANDLFDLFLVDFPDPNSYAVGKLYTRSFYGLLARRLDPEGAIAVQSTSPLFARRSYWIIERTIAAAGLLTRPYHATVPSFGEWGYVLASARTVEPDPARLPRDLKYLTAETLPSLFVFGADMAYLPVPINRLNDQVLVHQYEKEWRKFE